MGLDGCRAQSQGGVEDPGLWWEDCFVKKSAEGGLARNIIGPNSDGRKAEGGKRKSR